MSDAPVAGQWNNVDRVLQQNIGALLAQMSVSGSGVVTFANGFTNTAGDVTVGARLVFTTAAAKIVPGATSISLRNNADSADNLLISDTGAVTMRTGAVLTVGSSIQTGAAQNLFLAPQGGGIITSSALHNFTTRIQVQAAAIAGSGSDLVIGNGTATTIGAAGGAAALPATPLGYLNWYTGATNIKIPYYNP